MRTRSVEQSVRTPSHQFSLSLTHTRAHPHPQSFYMEYNNTDLADRDEFHRQVGRLPLSAGKSRLCHEACPALVEHYRQLMTLQQQQTMPQQQQQQHLQESLRRPQTIELDSMLQLVLNCQQRLQFVADQRVQRQLPSHVLVDVARPGVPFNYLGIPVVDGRSRSDESGMADNDATIREDDGVVVEEEYDWLRKLVLDR